MGKGDRKTRKGKTAIRSYGNVRPHKAKTVAKKASAPAAKKPALAPKVAPAKKPAPVARKKA
jgi:ribosomal small subunit protein bTHX